MGKKLLLKHRYNLVPEFEIYNRIKNFQKKLSESNIPVAIIYYPVNCYYFTGANQDEILIVYADREPVLLVKRDLERAKNDSPITQIFPLKSFSDLKKFINEKRVGFEFDYITLNECKKFQSIIDAEFVDITQIINELRSIKSKYEISLMKHAGEIAKKVYLEGANYLKKGLTEIEFAGILEKIARKYGHEGILRTGSFRFESYTSHIMCGYTSTFTTKTATPTGGMGLSPAFPCGASFNEIKENKPILVDFGICFMGYQVDETRMFSIGEPEEEFVNYYKKILKIQHEIFENLKPGIIAGDFFDFIYEKSYSLGIEKYFLGFNKKFNFIGHGIGLHTSEFPVIAKNFNYLIKENMTFAFEPKMVIPEKYGLGIEDTVVVRKDRVERITSIPEEIICV